MAPSRATIYQTTLARSVDLDGIGLHTGERIGLTLSPARAGSGLTFVSEDGAKVPARSEHVVSTLLATTLGKGEARISTVEHLLAALSGMGVDNATVQVRGNELPIADGSSAPFVAAIREAGLTELSAERQVILVRRPFTVREGVKEATLWPAPCFRVSYSIDFAHPAIGSQQWDGVITPHHFAKDLAPARTFGFERAVEMLRASGLAKGGHGRIRFTPDPGPAGKRKIVAFVEQNGRPRDQITVTTFTYRPLKLTRPRHLRVKRKGSRLIVTFGAVKGADLYNVSIQLSDGRRRFFLVRRKPHPVRLAKLAAGTHGFVLVSAQRKGERHGPVARAKLKAKHRRH